MRVKLEEQGAWMARMQAVMDLLLLPDGTEVTAVIEWVDGAGEAVTATISGDKRAVAGVLANSTIK